MLYRGIESGNNILLKGNYKGVVGNQTWLLALAIELENIKTKMTRIYRVKTP